MPRLRRRAVPTEAQTIALLPQIRAGVRRPAPTALLTLWLYLPVDLKTPRGLRRFQSSLKASLDDCRAATHRDAHGDVRPGAHAGSWLGAMGYLALLDQIGGSVESLAPRQAVAPSTSHVEHALAQFSSLPADDGVCLFALRNSLTHHFSLVNLPRGWKGQSLRRLSGRQRQLTRLFTLSRGEPRLIQPPISSWDPTRPNTPGTATTVDVQLMGDLAEEVVRALYRHFETGALRIRVDLPITPPRWRVGRFFSFMV
jgi:hypothetical protein